MVENCRRQLTRACNAYLRPPISTPSSDISHVIVSIRKVQKKRLATAYKYPKPSNITT